MNIYLLGEIGWEITAAKVVELLEDIGDQELTVILSSPGGSVVEGISIYNLLAKYKPIFKVLGQASSAASLVTCAGKEVIMFTAATMLIHNPKIENYWGALDKEKLEELGQTIEQYADIAAQIYAKKSGKEASEWLTIMDEAKTHTAEECVELGLADKVIEPDDAEANSSREMRMNAALSMMQGAVSQTPNHKPVLGRPSNTQISNPKIDDPNNKSLSNNKGDVGMTLEERNQELTMQVSTLNAERGTIQTELEASKQGTTELSAANVTLTGNVEELTAKNTELSTKNDELSVSLFAAEEKVFLDELSRDGKMTPAEIQGSAKEGETPETVQMLVDLRMKDEDGAYKAVRTMLSNRPKIDLNNLGITSDPQGASGDNWDDVLMKSVTDINKGE